MKTLILTLLVFVASSITYANQELIVPYIPPESGDLCWNKEFFNRPVPRMEDLVAELSRDGGLYTVIDLHTDPRIEVVGAGTYRIPNGMTVPIEVEQYSAAPESRPYRYIVLVNEVQTEAFTIEGKPQPYLDVVLEPEIVTSIHITLPEMKDGIYEVVILSVDLSPSAYNGQLTRSGGYRFTFIAGSGHDLQRQMDFNAFPNTDTRFGSLRLEPEAGSSAWDNFDNVVIVKPDEHLSFNVLVAYAGANAGANLNVVLETSYVALIAFVNGEQVTVNEDQYVVYAAVPLDEVAAVPFTILAPNTLGTHELMVVRLDNPIIANCVLRGPNGEYWFPNDVSFVSVPFVVDVE
jgi:hypothetical protein